MMDAPITLEDIQKAKAVLAQAEAALGVAQPVAKAAPIPTHPKHLEDPAFGDKTPAVVEWYRDNDPEEYKRRYAGRKTHLEDRRKERSGSVASDIGHSANDKVRNSQEQETPSRRSLRIAGSDTNLNRPHNCAKTVFPDHKSEGTHAAQGGVTNSEERSEPNAEITRAGVIKILSQYARSEPDEYSDEVRLKARALLNRMTGGSSNRDKSRLVETALRAKSWPEQSGDCPRDGDNSPFCCEDATQAGKRCRVRERLKC